MFCKCSYALDKSLEHWWYGLGDFGARDGRGNIFYGNFFLCWFENVS
jgi:hypothetical protein